MNSLLSDPTQLERLAAVPPDPRWTAEQKRQASEIAAAAARLAAAQRQVELAEQRLADLRRRAALRPELIHDAPVLERAQADARRHRAIVMARFQAMERKSNELMQAMTKIMRSLGETRRMGAASRSGL